MELMLSLKGGRNLVVRTKKEMINTVRKMYKSAYRETENSGFDEWDQTFIELLFKDLLNHLNLEGLEKLASTIEKNSTSGINRNQYNKEETHAE